MRRIDSWVPFRAGLSLILLAGLVHPTLARIGPSFALDYCSWHATNVVLVEITPSPGVFRVVESWKGDLESGSSVAIPALAPAVGAEQISSYPNFDGIGSGAVREQMPAQPVGSHMVLFLKREADASGEQWRSADFFNEIKASVVWIDREHLYCFRQTTNPGPTILVPLEISLEKLKDRVNRVRDLEIELTGVIASRDGPATAEGLKTILRSDVYEAQRTALSELAKCGPRVLVTIREMMADPAFADERADLLKAFAQAGGESVGEELDRLLQEQLRFWQATAPTLPVGWWNEDTNPHAPLRERYMQTRELVLALERLDYRPALATAEQLESLWRSLPQLNDASGLNQMVAECNKLAEHLRAN